MKIDKKLASSGTLEGIRGLIAEFYYSTPDRVALTEQDGYWAVQNGSKAVSAVVVRQGKRFIFGVPVGHQPSLGGAKIDKTPTAGSLHAIKGVIAEFYNTAPDRVSLVDRGGYWSVTINGVAMSTVVTRYGNRFFFVIGQNKALSGMGSSVSPVEYAQSVLDAGDFDTVSGTYAYFSVNHGGQGSDEYRALSILGREFNPGPMWSESRLSESEVDAFNLAAEILGGEPYGE